MLLWYAIQWLLDTGLLYLFSKLYSSHVSDFCFPGFQGKRHFRENGADPFGMGLAPSCLTPPLEPFIGGIYWTNIPLGVDGVDWLLVGPHPKGRVPPFSLWSSGRITPTKRTEELVKNFYAADYEAFGFWRLSIHVWEKTTCLRCQFVLIFLLFGCYDCC